MKHTIWMSALLSLLGCDFGVEWREGDYEVHWVDTASNRTLARSLGDGMSIGRVDPEVIAIGTNQDYIVAKRRDLSGGSISYYVVDKRQDSKYLNMSEITEGPMSEKTFLKLKADRALPEFSERFGRD